jgi:cobalt/nickel transport system permease protein
MHIMEGYLIPVWAMIWWLVAIPFLAVGISRLRKVLDADREALPLLGVVGGFVFILSALKLPSVTGSSSHPTGTGLSAIAFGPWITVVLSAVVLLFQALFLAHGGLSTMGANIVSMGVVGPVVGWGIYRSLRDTRVSPYTTVFLACVFADLFTYVTTSLQLALAPPVNGTMLMNPPRVVVSSFIVFLGIFGITQVPLALLEGVILALVFKYIVQIRPEILIRLKIFPEEKILAARGS